MPQNVVTKYELNSRMISMKIPRRIFSTLLVKKPGRKQKKKLFFKQNHNRTENKIK